MAVQLAVEAQVGEFLLFLGLQLSKVALLFEDCLVDNIHEGVSGFEIVDLAQLV